MDDHPKFWFRAWLKYHQGLNPHKEWGRYQAPGFKVVYRGWVHAFRARGVTLEDARAASVRMQGEASLYPEKHLARVVRLAGRIKEDREADRRAKDTERRLRAERDEARRHAKIKALWGTLPEEVKEPYRQWARNNHPDMARFEKFVELTSRNRWFELSAGRVTNPQAVGA